jgi:hypothetical protein
VPEGNEATRFKPGQSGNPKGRPKGSRHKISEAFLGDLLDHYQKHGFEAIDRMRKEDPTAYIRMIASLVPKIVEKAPDPLANLTDEELGQLETYLESIAQKGERGADPGGDRQSPH